MKKHKFTWVDGLIIAVVALLIIGTGVKFLLKEETAVNNVEQEFTYQLQIKNLRQVSVDSLRVGDELFDNEGKASVGFISDIAVTDAVTSERFPDGTMHEVTIEDRYDVVLTVTARGVPKDGAYQVGTYDIRVNNFSTYYTKYSIWSAITLSVN